MILPWQMRKTELILYNKKCYGIYRDGIEYVKGEDNLFSPFVVMLFYELDYSLKMNYNNKCYDK